MLAGEGGMFVRPSGSKDSFYAPERDILQVWPSCIVRGAAYAVDPASDIYSWLMQQDGVNNTNVVNKMRKCLVTCLKILLECRTAALNEVLTPDRVEWSIFKALMFGAGIMAFNTFNISFRKSRLTEVQHGAILDPAPYIDNERALSIFDDLIKQSYEGTSL